MNFLYKFFFLFSVFFYTVNAQAFDNINSLDDQGVTFKSAKELNDSIDANIAKLLSLSSGNIDTNELNKETQDFINTNNKYNLDFKTKDYDYKLTNSNDQNLNLSLAENKELVAKEDVITNEAKDIKDESKPIEVATSSDDSSDALVDDNDKYNLQINDDNSKYNLAINQNIQDQNNTPFSYEVTKDKYDIYVKLKAKEGSYFYKDSIKVKIDNGEFVLEPLKSGILHQDLLGEQEVYFDEVTLHITILSSFDGSNLDIEYQGCDENGICYPPANINVKLEKLKNDNIDSLESVKNLQATNYADSDNISVAEKVERTLKDNIFLGLAFCFLLGITLTLTPCVLPMLPIFSAMIVGSNKSSFSNIVLKNVSYSAGLSITYMFFGILFSIVGASLNAYLQHSLVTFTIAILLVICALSCADLFEIKLPAKFTQFIQEKAAKQTKGSLVSAFLFGAISATISTPCTSAPLAGALLFVLNSGSIALGALAFLAIGLGMSFPLLLVGIFGTKFLPKNGKISKYVKKLIAIPLLIAAYFIIENHILDYEITALFILIFVVLAYFIHITLEFLGFDIKNLHRTTGICVAFIITFLIISNYTKQSNDEVPSIFVEITSIDALNKYNDKPIILDFYSDWCTNCKVMDKTVFTDEKFINETKDYYHLKFDITNTDSKKVQEMISHYKLIGVPYIVVTNSQKEIKATQIGLISTDDLLNIIKGHK